jgi:hypothetical protein
MRIGQFESVLEVRRILETSRQATWHWRAPPPAFTSSFVRRQLERHFVTAARLAHPIRT